MQNAIRVNSNINRLNSLISHQYLLLQEYNNDTFFTVSALIDICCHFMISLHSIVKHFFKEISVKNLEL